MFFYNILVFFYLYYLILGVIYIHGRIIYFFTHDKTIMKTKFFTLLELLIVIGIIAILMAIIIPSLSRAKGDAIQTQCASNMRQCYNALIMYADTNDHWIPVVGADYTGWFRQPGIPETLGFMMPREYKDPHSYRAVTLCPAGVDNIEWVGNAAFGMPAFLYTPEDYINYKCENNNNGALYIKITAIPSHSAYALLADSAFTKFEPKPQNAPGAQCRLFSRRDEGAASPICHAICERHNGTANITYADGHIDTSKNKTAILDSSYIGAYVDMSGHELIYVE